MSEPHIITAEVALRQNLEVGESARWFDGSLHWVDVPSGRRFRWNGDASQVETVQYGDVVTAVFRAADDRVGVVTRDAVEVAGTADIPLGIDDGRSNDARVTPAGGLWVGTWVPDVTARTARLLHVSDGSVSQMLDGLTMSNGIGFVGTHAYHADTFARTVNRYRIDPDGAIVEHSNGAISAEFVTVADALPDGLTVDSEGGVWVALWGGGCARRYAPDGRCTHEVRTPGATQVSSVALGGPDLRDLYLTTAAEDVEEPNAGSLFVARAEVSGLREHVFTDRNGRVGEEDGDE